MFCPLWANQFANGSADATIDIQCNYSLDPSAAEQLYGTQENFVKSICAVDIRSIPRTISIGNFTSAIQEALGSSTVLMQSKFLFKMLSIKDKYSEATAKQTSLNQQEVAKVDVIQANANKVFE